MPCNVHNFKYLNYLLTIIIYLGLSSPSQAEKPLTIVMSTIESKPWMYKSGAQHKGILADIFSALSKDAGCEIIFRLVPARRGFTDIMTGASDVAAIITSNFSPMDSYLEKLHINDEALFELTMAAVGLTSKNISASSIDQISNYRLGALRLVKSMQNGFVPSGTPLNEYRDSDTIIKGVMSGRIDLGIGALANLLVAMDSMGVKDQISVAYIYNERVKISIAWSKKSLESKGYHLPEKIDEILKRYKREGFLEKIIKQYSDSTYFHNYDATQ